MFRANQQLYVLDEPPDCCKAGQRITSVAVGEGCEMINNPKRTPKLPLSWLTSAVCMLPLSSLCFPLVTEGRCYRKFAGGSESGPSFYLFPEVRKSCCIFRITAVHHGKIQGPEWLTEGETDQTKTQTHAELEWC